MKIKIHQYIHIFLGQYISTIRKRIGASFFSKSIKLLCDNKTLREGMSLFNIC